MMISEMHDAFKEAFCHELREIHSRLGMNGGKFSTDREICCARDCIQALKDLAKIETMSSKPVMR